MKSRKEGVAVCRLDERRYAVTIDRLVWYVGSLEECERRAKMLGSSKSNRYMQDRALVRACRW
jgi:hypothetical protein